MNTGYVYVLAFDNGIVKVGRTANIKRRLIAHAGAAHNFGIAVTGRWVSPRHGGWIGNEDALLQAAHDLGGIPTTPEYFKGVSFEALTARAQCLSFTADLVPRRLPLDAAAIRRARVAKFLLQAEVAAQVQEQIATSGIKFDRSGLSLIENGKVKRPAPTVVRGLIEVLGMTPKEIYAADEAA